MDIQTIWSRAEIRKEFQGCENLKDLITRLEDKFWPLGHVITSVKVNGMWLSEADEVKFSYEGLQFVESLEVQLSEPQLLLRETTQSYLELIPRLKELTFTCAERFRKHEIEQASPQFLDIIEGCRWLTDALYLLRTQVSQWKPISPEGDWRKAEESYTQILKQILSSFESKDYVLLSDLLEYELTNRLDHWQMLLQGLKKMLN